MSLHEYILYVIMPILVISMVLTFIRFLKGPNVVDRVIAIDLIITIGISIFAAFSMLTGEAVFLDIAMILALIAFLSTVAYSYYLEKRERND